MTAVAVKQVFALFYVLIFGAVEIEKIENRCEGRLGRRENSSILLGYIRWDTIVIQGF